MEILLSEFTVKGINIDGEKFNKVSRAHLMGNDMQLVLDYHNELLPLTVNQIIEIVLYDKIVDVPHQYTYVMQGKVYKISNDGDKKIINASFGGLCLLLSLKNDSLEMINEFSDLLIGIRVLE